MEPSGIGSDWQKINSKIRLKSSLQPFIYAGPIGGIAKYASIFPGTKERGESIIIATKGAGIEIEGKFLI